MAAKVAEPRLSAVSTHQQGRGSLVSARTGATLGMRVRKPYQLMDRRYQEAGAAPWGAHRTRPESRALKAPGSVTGTGAAMLLFDRGRPSEEEVTARLVADLGLAHARDPRHSRWARCRRHGSESLRPIVRRVVAQQTIINLYRASPKFNMYTITLLTADSDKAMLLPSSAAPRSPSSVGFLLRRPQDIRGAKCVAW